MRRGRSSSWDCINVVDSRVVDDAFSPCVCGRRPADGG